MRFLIFIFSLFLFSQAWGSECIRGADYRLDFRQFKASVKELAEHASQRVQVKKIKMGREFLTQIRIFSVTERPRLRVLLAGGTHGNEPVAVLGVVDMLKKILTTEEFSDVEVLAFPLLNPSGAKKYQRHTRSGVDLNRCFSHDEPCDDAIAKYLVDVLENETFDISIDLHGGNKTRTGYFILLANEKVYEAANFAIDQIDEDRSLSPLVNYPGSVGHKANPKVYFFLRPGVALSHNVGTLTRHMSSKNISAFTVEYPPSDSVEDIRNHLVILAESLILGLPQMNGSDMLATNENPRLKHSP